MKSEVVEGLLYLKTDVMEAYCVCDEETDIWHAVLGNYYPNFPGDLPKMSDSEEVALELTRNPKERLTQRLCDQRLVSYKYVSIRDLSGIDPLTICTDCIRIKKLTIEFATKYPEEVEDVADNRHDGNQDGAP